MNFMKRTLQTQFHTRPFTMQPSWQICVIQTNEKLPSSTHMLWALFAFERANTRVRVTRVGILAICMRHRPARDHQREANQSARRHLFKWAQRRGRRRPMHVEWVALAHTHTHRIKTLARIRSNWNQSVFASRRPQIIDCVDRTTLV